MLRVLTFEKRLIFFHLREPATDMIHHPRAKITLHKLHNLTSHDNTAYPTLLGT